MVSYSSMLWGRWLQSRWPLTPNLSFPFRLQLPDGYDADRVSQSALAALILQGTPLTNRHLCFPMSSMWQLTLGKQRSRSAEGTLARDRLEGCWLRRSRCRLLINMVMSSAMTSDRKTARATAQEVESDRDALGKEVRSLFLEPKRRMITHTIQVFYREEI